LAGEKMKKYEHVPVNQKTKNQLDEIGRKLSKIRKVKSVSYNEIVEYLLTLEGEHIAQN
jgi:hypothetical protein